MSWDPSRFVRDHDDDLAAGTPASCDSFRQLYERALSAGGLHVAQGSQLWNVARYAQSSASLHSASIDMPALQRTCGSLLCGGCSIRAT